MEITSKRFNYLKNKKFYLAKAIALAIFPIVLLVLPANFFDSGPELCLFTRLSGFHCPGCGMTRACMHLIHFDLGWALTYNKMSFVVLPMLCYMLLKEFLMTIKKYKNN
jgi:hypothetical protein